MDAEVRDIWSFLALLAFLAACMVVLGVISGVI